MKTVVDVVDKDKRMTLLIGDNPLLLVVWRTNTNITINCGPKELAYEQ